MTSIHVLNGTSFSLRDIERLVKSIQNIYSLPVFARNQSLNLEEAYDPIRRQFNSTVLLAQMLLLPNEHKNKLISLVEVDLYVPILTFVFGEAQLNGTVSIVSTHRLSNLFYGLKNDPELLLSRTEKETIHEIGHMFGLTHCHHFECVMRPSTYAEEIDFKKIFLCSSCSKKLTEKLNQSAKLSTSEREENSTA